MATTETRIEDHVLPSCSLCGRELNHKVYHSKNYCSWDCEFLSNIRLKPKAAPLVQQVLPMIDFAAATPLAAVPQKRKEEAARTVFRMWFGKG